MTDKVREQIMAIRNSGKCNMFSIHEVQRIAFDSGYYELVTYIEEHPREYADFILHGREDG